MNKFGSLSAAIGSLTRRCIGSALQFPGSGSFVTKDYNYNTHDLGEALIIGEGESVTPHIWRAAQNISSHMMTPELVRVCEEIETIPGTEGRIEVAMNICAKPPVGAEKVFVIHDNEPRGEAFWSYLRPSPSEGLALTYKVEQAARFNDQMSARKFLNEFLMKLLPGSSYSQCYAPLGVGVAYVFPGTPAKTVTKRVLG